MKTRIPNPSTRYPLPQRTARAAHVLLCVAPLLLCASSAFAAEELVENLEGMRKFAPMWPGGTFEMGSDAGFHWARVVTDGQAGATFVSNVRPYRPTFDATGKFVKTRVKIDDLQKLGGMEFRLSSDRFAANYYAFSFPIYDDPDFNVVRDGVWATLTFSFDSARVEGSPDRSHLNSVGWYVSDQGNAEPVTAHWGGLSLVDAPREGVVSITFDDGYDEHLLAAQLMAEHGFRGTAYIIPEAIGQLGYLNHHQLVDMQERYGWDVGAHHETPFTELRPDEIENTILGVQHFLIENKFAQGAGHLAYPLGKQNTSAVRPLVRKHFATARVAAAGPETLPPADAHLLRVMNVTQHTTPEQVGEAARSADENGAWLILMLHYLVEDKASNDLEYRIDDFKKLLVQIKESGAKVLPLTEVWESCGRDFAGPSPTPRCEFGAVAAPQP
ncbi:MAG: polysaccharide deacetylase family protein [bacterium]|nr:polysaccharide deacetylase family protein [bacterium]